MQSQDIQQVRRFNRLVTQRIGALGDSYLARGRPLGEARLIFELGSSGATDLAALRQRLGLDSGYLSRLLRSLEGQGVLELRKKAEDGRARDVVLTEKGREEFSAYDTLSDTFARDLLAPLGDAQRQRLVAAMGEVEQLLRAASVTIAPEAADSADARRCLDAYIGELADRFEGGFEGGSFGTADMTPPVGWLLLARLDGEAIACGALKRLDATTGEIKRVWVSPTARGMGVAGRLMDRLEALAGEIGCRRVLLDTNRTLTEAKAMYLKRGYSEIGRYNDNPYADHWFEKRL
ncbi:bifunctional helix-turn-helix transcriptional regulator/GNAT family N-acetyltransferase [Ollibium composti]|uniref:MarR family transcriptional regulator n=1 Tax=Ollibium composti TaxID=2675109 RepID=A0ABY2Q8H3_9HYPH|nr:helix-turn-helix domain-containing GNAT family N-acetyltransferase [Mesorhizobium composti]THF57907.1 MarR family transcriptional regulator [Mesorhizobium composti]